MAIKICLDAGHYGKSNRSPAVPEYYESDMNWKLHLLLKAELEKYGFEVKTTRADKDKDLYVTDRGLASKGCDMFLSLHSNAVGNGVNENVDHVALYHLTKDDNLTIDEKSQDLALKLAPVIADVMEVKNGARVMTRVSPTDKNGDGVMNDNYYGVLNGARIAGTPGMIIEHSFHTQTRATKWLMQDANLAKLAKAEAKVIAEYFGISYPQSEPVFRVTIENVPKTRAAELVREGAERGWAVNVEAMEVAEVAPEAPAEPAPAPEIKPEEIKVEYAKERTNALAGTYRVNVQNSLNVRAGAGLDKPVVAKLNPGDLVKCYGYHTNEWLNISAADGIEGYCHRGYLVKI